MSGISDTRSWRYDGYTVTKGSMKWNYTGPKDWRGEADGWGVFQSEKSGKLQVCNFGKFKYKNNNVSTLYAIAFYLDNDMICSYEKDNKYQWITSITFSPYEQYYYSTNQTPLNLGLNPYFFYDTEVSPIYSPRKARKLNKDTEKMIDEEDMDYN